jgi:5-methylcytosine-specific restriction endonuclease McrA
MGRKTPPCKHYPAWTVARYNTFIRSALRKAWSRWPPKFEVLKENRRTVTGKRHRYEYKCAKCKKWFQQKHVQVDHITPAGSHVNWDTFIEKLFVGKDKLQILCRPCHAVKTKSERSK